jgi:FkbM family methyltransferase
MQIQQITKQQLLPLIAPYLPENPVIIEAGAFNGTDTKKLIEQWPHATVHAFEPVPEIFALLQKNTASYSNVFRYNCALSDTTATALFHISESPKKRGAPFQAGSLLQPKERLTLSPVEYPCTIQVATTTLDDWAQKHGITKIDCTWLDMQGYELNVLKAAPKMLQTMRVIYTEVEFVEAYAGQYLYKDVKQWLEEHGFIMIARDFPDNPTWFFGNAVFVRKDII